MDDKDIWMAIGFVGQGFFSARFIVQWLASERVKRSIIPVAFWYFSLGGGLTLLAYAIHRKDPVFIAGQSAGIFVYLRNLYLLRIGRRELQA
ncbi:MAG: lipid-A-disaccharide synthase N-terminal domain-containing protein [Steroidobacteraceae bacterium]